MKFTHDIPPHLNSNTAYWNEMTVQSFIQLLAHHMEANNPTDDETYFLTATILSIMEILPKDGGEKRGKTNLTKIEDANEIGKKP